MIIHLIPNDFKAFRLPLNVLFWLYLGTFHPHLFFAFGNE